MWPYIATANRACSLLYSYIKKHSSGIWLLPVNICPDVPLTFCLANVQFQFVDIDPETLCINIVECQKLIENSTYDYTGIIYVRTYGVCKNTRISFESLKSISNDFLIIDDRCLCVPEDNPSFYGADMILYSTGHCKQLDFGMGGMACYSNETLYEIDPALKYDGLDETTLYNEAYKKELPLSAIPQGWLKMEYFWEPVEYIDKIKKSIPQRIKQRKAINAIYKNNLPSDIQFPDEFNDWRYNIRVSPSIKNALLHQLFTKGLFASNHYHSVNRLFDTRKFPVSDRLFSEVINLFNDQYYTEDKAFLTCQVINEFL